CAKIDWGDLGRW
nr:immunoglobulin heavy chain junction region [Macaca mulatta]MOW75398.1 immunoglobulin heavy chain junction region [Macaca mulatta]MOW75517.1 immunoglobulin heavy chain junction region [Macaca mulatta]MOW75596.1 immunoglobulin heavy chain junction region [Macaca mulatta]MOW76216.1 immunoglobulin heavy chain junction region [Macaca mulatta]